MCIRDRAALLAIYLVLSKKIADLNDMSSHQFVSERVMLTWTVILFVLSFTLKIVLCTLQIHQVFTMIDLR